MKNSIFKIIAVLLVITFISVGFPSVTFGETKNFIATKMPGITYEFGETDLYPFENKEIEQENYITIDGEIAYCLDFEARLEMEGGNTQREGQSDYNDLGADEKELVQLVMHHGYHGDAFAGMDSNQSYFVTQVLIWLITSEYFYDSDKEAQIIETFFEKMDGGPDEYIEKYYDLKTQILSEKLYPSFNGRVVGLVYNEATELFEATLTDTNNVLQYFKVEQPDGAIVEHLDGSNVMKITSSDLRSVVIKMTRKFERGPLIYWVDNTNKPALQALATADASKNCIEASVKTTKLAKVEITKIGDQIKGIDVTDSEYGQIYKPEFEKEKPIAGIEFSIIVLADVMYWDEDGNLKTYEDGDEICKITTDAEGKAVSAPIPMFVEYRIKETSADSGYLLFDDVFKNNDTKDIYLKKTIKNIRQKLNITFQKSMDLAIGETIKPYDEVVFGVFSEEEVAAGNYKIPADSLVALITPDSDGNAVCKDLLAGKYYLKELKTAEGYILDSTEYPFELKYNSDGDAEIDVSVNNGEPIENDIIKGKGKIKKTDRSGKGLAGAVFHVYTEDGLFVAEVVSDENGNTPEVELTYGKYYWVEIKAPDGCRLDKTKYYFEIIQNGVEYETTVKNYYKTTVTTGDVNNILLWVSLSLCSLFVFWCVNRRKRIAIRT